MTVNPDPKPGRWILPLVILGMIAFTYFFIRELPAAPTDTTPVAGVTTTLPDGEPGETTDPGTDPGPDNGDVQAPLNAAAYLDQAEEISAELQELDAEMTAINAGFDADPREVEFSQAVSRFESVIADADALVERFDALVPPAELQGHHDSLMDWLGFAADAAADALTGLRSEDTGEGRTAAGQAFTRFSEDFDTELTSAYSTAGLTRAATTDG